VAIVLMIGGIALLGALAGSLGAFLRVQDTVSDGEEPATRADDARVVTASELTALRAELAEVNRRLVALQTHLGIPDEPPP
jgi:hypothetical protein